MNDRDSDDNTIVENIKAGKNGLFRVLVERHQQQVFALGMSFFRNTDESEDFTQDVFIKTFQSIRQFQGKARFSTWLYRVAYNTAINMVHRRQTFQSLAESDQMESLSLTPEEENLRQTAKKAVRQAVSELPERYRICVDLFFFYDRSYEEIEVITGFPVNTIKSHVFRAKKILREKLQDV